MDPAVASRGGEPPALGGGVRLFRVRGIWIRLERSWFLIALLLLASLAIGYFPGVAPEASIASRWLAALLATLLFFASIVAHELAHSLVAIRAGIRVPDITLFLFGGVSRLASQPRTPQVELLVAIAGPLTSFALAVGFGLLAWAAPPEPWYLDTTLGYLAWINLALGVFNLLPGYPLDGGRVLRALVWWRTGSLRRGTRVASTAGKAFATAIVVLGGVQIFAGALVGGIWLVLIGLFLRRLAAQGYEELVLRRALADATVERVMTPRAELVTVPSDLPLRALVDDYLLGRGHRGYPVMEGERVVGLITADSIRRGGRDGLDEGTVRDRATPLSDAIRIDRDAPLAEALRRMSAGPEKRLLVLDGDALTGLVTLGSLLRFVDLRKLAEDL